MWERLGGKLSVFSAGGVLMVEATKRVQAPRGPGLRASVRKPLEALNPKPKPVPKPV
jgi:hypothetical protein